MDQIEAAIAELETEKQELLKSARETVSECLMSMAMATDRKIGSLRRAAEILAQSKTPPAEWQNLDRIIDELERAGCTRNGYVHAPEDVVANVIRDWLRSLRS